jgi:hypothetical protein
VAFNCSPTVDRVYAQAVPASTFNYQRKLNDATKIEGNTANQVVSTQNIQINGTAAGLVVQDGVNQGWIILPDATARRLQRYSQWTTTNREYVPIMKQMAYINGILFGVAPDGSTLLQFS